MYDLTRNKANPGAKSRLANLYVTFVAMSLPKAYRLQHEILQKNVEFSRIKPITSYLQGEHVTHELNCFDQHQVRNAYSTYLV